MSGGRERDRRSGNVDDCERSCCERRLPGRSRGPTPDTSLKTSATGTPEWKSAVTMPRIRAMSAAAATPWPVTSPTTSAILSPSSRRPSYQSPPTEVISLAGDAGPIPRARPSSEARRAGCDATGR